MLNNAEQKTIFILDLSLGLVRMLGFSVLQITKWPFLNLWQVSRGCDALFKRIRMCHDVYENWRTTQCAAVFAEISAYFL